MNANPSLDFSLFGALLESELGPVIHDCLDRARLTAQGAMLSRGVNRLSKAQLNGLRELGFQAPSLHKLYEELGKREEKRWSLGGGRGPLREIEADLKTVERQAVQAFDRASRRWEHVTGHPAPSTALRAALELQLARRYLSALVDFYRANSPSQREV